MQFYAYKTQTAGSQPVYRFFNTTTGTHFYTIVTAEKDFVIQNYPVFVYEGPVYYAMNTPVTGSEDLYRFYNTQDRRSLLHDQRLGTRLRLGHLALVHV